MKIGIISMQRVPNYGSFLQAEALRQVLIGLGHEVCFIDYKNDPPAGNYSKTKRMLYTVLSYPAIRLFLDSCISVIRPGDFRSVYRRKYLPMLGVSYRKNYSEVVDVAIIGSDEVFNCTTSMFNIGFSPMLLGCIAQASRVISYAASAGETTYDRIVQLGIREKTIEYLSHIDAISVRDTNTYSLVRRLIEKKPTINVDPVFLYDYELAKVERLFPHYAVLYTYPSRAYSESERKDIQDFCINHGFELVSFGATQEWVTHRFTFDPYTMLAHFKQADYIITDTFHGTVLSIKYNKQFVTHIRDDNKNKLTDLLLKMRQEGRMIEEFSSLETYWQKKTEFKVTNEIICDEKEKALNYLRNELADGI